MPTCAVPGCTSGYATNHEQVHSFAIPKNLSLAKEWLTSIRRLEQSTIESIEQGRRKYVCEHHFLKDQISWQRELCDPTGRVLGVFTNKVPRLKPGTVPSRFPWDDVCPSSNRVEAIRAKPLLELPRNTICSGLLLSEKIDLPPKNATKDLEQPARNKEDKSRDTDMGVNVDDISHSLQWADIATTVLSLPPGWLAQKSELKISGVLTLITLKTTNYQGLFQVIVAKAAVVADDMSVQVSIYGQPVNLTAFSLPNHIESIQSLENLLLSIHGLCVCTGLTVEEEMADICCTTLRKGDDGQYRHINCSGLLPDTATCRFCQTGKKSLSDKLLRVKKNKLKNKVSKTTPSTNPEEWSELHERYCRAVREKQAALQKNKFVRHRIGHVK